MKGFIKIGVGVGILAIALLSGILFSFPANAPIVPLTHNYTEISFSHACSYYRIGKANTQDDFNTNLDTLKLNKYTESVGQFREKPGDENWEWAINQTYMVSFNVYGICYRPVDISEGVVNGSIKNCADIGCDVGKSPTECNCSYSCITGKRQEQRWRTVWARNDGGISAKSNLIWQHTQDLGYTRVRFCADFTREKTERGWSIRLDHIPEFAEVSYEGMTWWDSDYPYRYEIYSNATLVTPISVNDTYGICGEIIWTLNDSSADGEKKSSYRKVSGCVTGDRAIANETDETAWENETSRTGYNPTEVWDESYVAVYHFGEADGITLHDSSRYGNDGTAADGGTDAWNASGNFGGSFQGNDSTYYNMGNTGSLSSPTTSGTIEVWFKSCVEAPNSQFILSKGDGIENTRNGYSLMSVSNHAFFRLMDGGGTTDCEGTTMIIDCKWHYFVGMWNGTHQMVYVDGVREDIDTQRTPVSDVWDLYIGSDPNYALLPLDGQIDEVRISNISRNDTYIWEQYYNGINNLTALGAEEEVVIAPPGISFIDPTPDNALYSTNNYTFVNASSSENVTSCNLEWDDGSPTNETMSFTNIDDNTTCFLNMTLLADGEYLYTVYGNLITIGLNATGQRNITIDTTEPAVHYIFPTATNTTIQFFNQTFINVSISDTNFQTALLDWEGVNETMTCLPNSCSANKTNITNGIYEYIVWANDSAGNMNSTEIRTIIIDRLAPEPTIQLPVNNSLIVGTQIQFNYSVNDEAPDTCQYEIDNEANVTIAGCANITITVDFGVHNITLYVNNTIGNLNRSTHFFNNTFAIWNISLFNENDWDTPFDVFLPDSVTLFLFCFGLDTFTFNMTDSSLLVLPTCNVESIMIRVEYPTDSYTRERLAPANMNATVLMYLVDAYNETLLQIPFIMGDSPFFASNLTLYKISSDGIFRIISHGRFDIEFKHVSYLIKDNKYQLRITSGTSIREIGFFQAVSAGDQTININRISLGPDITLISDRIMMAAETDDITGTLIIQYNDTLLQTNSVRILVYNGTEQTPFYNMTFTNQNDITVTLAVNTSMRYSIKFIVSHQQLGNSPIYFVIGAGAFGVLFNLGIVPWIYQIIGFTFILFTSFVITPKNRLVGIIFITAILAFMAFAAWLTLNIGVALILTVFVGIAVVYEIRRLGLI